jgi:hypothetical protein
MKKIVAKFLNAIKERRAKKRQTVKIKIGEIYFVKHTYRKDFYIKVTTVNDAWVEGFVMDADNVGTVGEIIIILRGLCRFTKLRG